MAKGLIIGFFAGAILAGLIFKFAIKPPAADADSAGAGATDTGAAGKGTGVAPGGGSSAGAGSDDAAYEARIAELQKKLTAAELRLAAAGRASNPDFAKRWKDLAGMIAQARKDADTAGGPMKNDAWIASFLALFGDFASDLGLPISEAAMSPEWYPRFAEAMLAASPYPLTEEQKKAFDAILAESGAGWEKYMAGRDSMTPLERAKALRDLQFTMFGKLAPLSTPEQVGYMGSLNLPPPGTPYQQINDGHGTREAVRTNISNNLSKSLGLDPNQMTSLGPAINDYMRSYESMQRDIALRKQAGESVDDLGMKLALSLEFQKQIGNSVRLTDAQAKALKDWNQVHDYQIKE